MSSFATSPTYTALSRSLSSLLLFFTVTPFLSPSSPTLLRLFSSLSLAPSPLALSPHLLASRDVSPSEQRGRCEAKAHLLITSGRSLCSLARDFLSSVSALSKSPPFFKRVSRVLPASGCDRTASSYRESDSTSGVSTVADQSSRRGRYCIATRQSFAQRTPRKLVTGSPPLRAPAVPHSRSVTATRTSPAPLPPPFLYSAPYKVVAIPNPRLADDGYRVSDDSGRRAGI